MVPEFTASLNSRSFHPKFTPSHSSEMVDEEKEKRIERRRETWKQNKPATLNPYYKTVRKEERHIVTVIWCFLFHLNCFAHLILFCRFFSLSSVKLSDSSSK